MKKEKLYSLLLKCAKKKIQGETKLLGEYIDWVNEKAEREDWKCKSPIMHIRNGKTYFYQENGDQFDFDSIMNKKYLNGTGSK